jgi:5-methylcytosine-specific restriction endonuclease McrA
VGVKYERAGRSLYSTERWKRVRFLAKKRDGFKCRECGASGQLEVHHERPIRHAPELAFELSNLKTLCKACHARITKSEVGFGNEVDPRRAAWRNLVDALARHHPKKETLCSIA